LTIVDGCISGTAGSYRAVIGTGYSSAATAESIIGRLFLMKNSFDLFAGSYATCVGSCYVSVSPSVLNVDMVAIGVESDNITLNCNSYSFGSS
jgi:hypothetical protein